MRIYIAAPFFTQEQLGVVVAIEKKLNGLNIEYFSPRFEGVLMKMTKEEKANNMERIYRSNVDNIFDCDTMIAVLDWPDTGTIFELGYMAALKERCIDIRTIVTLTSTNKKINVMLRHCVDAHLLGVDRIPELCSEIKHNGGVYHTFDAFPEINT